MRTMIVMLIVVIAISSIHIAAALLLEERRFSIKKTAFLWLMAGVVLFFDLFFCYKFLPKIFRLPVSLTIAYIYYWITFIYASADGFWKKCYLWLTYGCVFCISWTISSYFCKIVFPDKAIWITYLICSIMHVIICLPLLFLYREYVRPLIKEVSGFRAKRWRPLCGVSMLFFFIFVLLLSKIKDDDEIDFVILALFSLVVCAFVAANILCISNIYFMRKEARNELIKQKNDYLMAYLDSARKTEQESRRLKHDLRHHNEQIAYMARENDTEGILRYLCLNEENRSESVPFYSLHIMVNGILSSYARKAKDASIGYIAKADIKSESKISDVDFVSILANLLENALNASVEVNAKTPIMICVREFGAKTVITVSNQCKPNLKLEDGLPAMRSTGIDSILYSSKQYNGDVNYVVKDSICTACVILN